MIKKKTVGEIIEYNKNKIKKNKNQKIIGIDPGLKHLGISVIEVENKKPINYQAYLIKIKQQRNLEQKLYFIFTSVCKIIIKHKPMLAIVEDAFVGINKNSALKLGLARGSILTAIGKNEIEYKSISATRIKLNICGKGNCEKEEIKVKLQSVFKKFQEAPLDISDATAAAIYGINLL